jgi:hypothetical protein
MGRGLQGLRQLCEGVAGVNNENLVHRLRKRAEIRRQISTRKSVQEGKPDRIADLLEEAANALEPVKGPPSVTEALMFIQSTVAAANEANHTCSWRALADQFAVACRLAWTEEGKPRKEIVDALTAYADKS